MLVLFGDDTKSQLKLDSRLLLLAALTSSRKPILKGSEEITVNLKAVCLSCPPDMLALKRSTVRLFSFGFGFLAPMAVSAVPSSALGLT